MMRFFKSVKDHLQGKSKTGTLRSKFWPKARKDHLARYPRCAVCNGTKKLEVHHIRSFHEYPEWELEPSNFMTLCEGNRLFNCHRIFGHLNNYQRTNQDAKADAFIWRKKLEGVS